MSRPGYLLDIEVDTDSRSQYRVCSTHVLTGSYLFGGKKKPRTYNRNDIVTKSMKT